MVEQIAALDNQFKTPMSNSEKASKKPAEYQPVLTAEMWKEGSLLMASHIENSTFQYWWPVHGSSAVNSVINSSTREEQEQTKEMSLAVFNGTCNTCGQQCHKDADCYAKKHINSQILTPKSEVVWDQTMINITTTKEAATTIKRKSDSKALATIVVSLDTRKQIAERN